jgi:hypothetical protein
VNLKHAATIVTTGGALAAWIAGSVTTSRSVAQATVVARPAIDAQGAELAVEVSRLHDRLQPSATPRSPSRNLFRFRAAPPPHAVAPTAAPAAPQPETPAPPPVVPMRLVGMAEDTGPDGPVRTAFINVEGQLFNVREGEMLLQKYRVAKISADVVELADVGDGTVRRLALR